MCDQIMMMVHRVETMTLRLEDVNTKESSLRISIQTIDYRLGRLEEIASNTSETLCLMRSLLARQTAMTPTFGIPGVTVSRPPSSLPDDASEREGEGVYREPSPGPSVASWQPDNLGDTTEEVGMGRGDRGGKDTELICMVQYKGQKKKLSYHRCFDCCMKHQEQERSAITRDIFSTPL